jgi:hypothetical protein
VSVENLDGNGLADQPSIIYGFRNDNDDLEIRELSRAGYAKPGPSPGDVVERDSTTSDLSSRLPELELPGQRGLARDDCGDDIPAFYCEDCGHPKYVGRNCASPTCERDWPSAVKAKATRYAGKLEGLRRALYARYEGRKDIDFNHVVASLPSVVVDSESPKERVMKLLKTLLEHQWDIDGFAVIYHPYRIKKEYRKDQYEHGGAEGEGDMTWKDVLGKDDPMQYLKFEPHFHLFFPAIRRSFDYSVAEAVNEQSGWVFHRITKAQDSNVSVEDLNDLVHQLTYCLSHAGVEDTSADRSEFATRLKGDLHNCYIPDGVDDECLAAFCEAAPKLLGVRFSNVADANCDAEVASGGWSDVDEDLEGSSSQSRETPTDTPATWQRDTRSGSDRSRGLGEIPESGAEDFWAGGSPDSSAPTVSVPTEAAETSSGESPVQDAREKCGGGLAPIREASSHLEDQEWCQQAEYVSGLRTAVEEWRRRTGGDEDLPWLDDEDLVIDPG